MKREQIHLTQEQAQALCPEWQSLIGVADWDVIVKIVRRTEFQDSSNRQAECHYNLTRKQAIILLMDPADFPGVERSPFPQDMEWELVHELLHCHFAPFMSETAGDAQDTAQEQAIHKIAGALVTLKRSKC